MSVNEKMTAIADVIRFYTKDTEKLTLDGMVEGIKQARTKGYSSGYNAGRTKGKEEGIEEGRETERSEWWTNFFLDRYGDFSYAFYKMSDANYHPIYTPAPKYADQAYAQSKITEAVVDMSNTTSATSMFAASRITTLTIISTETTAWNTNMFTQAMYLTNLAVNGVIAKTFSVAPAVSLTHDSLMSLINALYDHSGSTDTYKVQLGSRNLAKLTTDEIAQITAKGWTYA